MTVQATQPVSPTAISASSERDVAAIDELRDLHQKVRSELARVIIGQDDVIEQLLICIFARGHALLMGVPGLAKTLLVHSLADVLSLKFNRIQFTPDLMPSDITGTDILQETRRPGRRAFEFVEGPDLRQHRAGRRDQPHAAEDAGGAAGSDAGAPASPPAAHISACRSRSSCSPRRTRSSRKARIRCPRRSSTGSCSSSTWTIRLRTRNCRIARETTGGEPAQLTKCDRRREILRFRNWCGACRCRTTFTTCGEPGAAVAARAERCAGLDQEAG